MNLASLRIEGDDRLLDALIEELDLPVDKQWTKGQFFHSGGTHSTSGFCATIVDSPSSSALLSRVREFISGYQGFLDANGGIQLAGEMSIEVTCDDPGQLASTVILGAEDLRRLGQAGLSLTVSAYPPSDVADSAG